MTSTVVSSTPASPAGTAGWTRARKVSPVLLLSVGLLVLAVACFASVALGARPLSLENVLQALVSQIGRAHV